MKKAHQMLICEFGCLFWLAVCSVCHKQSKNPVIIIQNEMMMRCNQSFCQLGIAAAGCILYMPVFAEKDSNTLS